MRRLRVLQIIDNFGMGGAEVWLLALLRRWKENPLTPQMEFLVTGGTTGALESEARGLGAKIHYLRFSQARLIPFARGFRRLLSAGAYDALHDHQDYAAGWHFMLGGQAMPPVRITHVHNPAYQVAENYGRSVRRRVAGGLAKVMIAHHTTHIAGTSRQAIDEHGFDTPAFKHIPKLPVYCGFDPAPFTVDRISTRASVRAEFGWPARARIALFTGRTDVSPDPGHARNHKNSGLAISIAVAACRMDPDVRVIFAGPPSSATPILEERIATARLSDRIRLLGIRRDIARLMRGADVLLFPSRSEGLGMVAVEAQAAGLHVLASTAVPHECVVIPSLVTFMDVNAGTQVWAQALARLAHAPRCAEYANEAVTASPFNIENSAARLAKLYAGQLSE